MAKMSQKRQKYQILGKMPKKVENGPKSSQYGEKTPKYFNTTKQIYFNMKLETPQPSSKRGEATRFLLVLTTPISQFMFPFRRFNQAPFLICYWTFN